MSTLACAQRNSAIASKPKWGWQRKVRENFKGGISLYHPYTSPPPRNCNHLLWLGLKQSLPTRALISASVSRCVWLGTAPEGHGGQASVAPLSSSPARSSTLNYRCSSLVAGAERQGRGGDSTSFPPSSVSPGQPWAPRTHSLPAFLDLQGICLCIKYEFHQKVFVLPRCLHFLFYSILFTSIDCIFKC